MNALSTGIPTLDRIFGGGLPKGSLIVLAGAPGTGKTILAQQWCFANASKEHPALYYTTLSEPHSKLVRHLEQFAFFQPDALGSAVEFNHLPALTGDGELEPAMHEIVRRSFEAHPSIVVLDSAKALHETSDADQRFREVVYDLASKVAHTDAVLVLVGEYVRDDVTKAAEFAVADGIISLDNDGAEPWAPRTLQILKMRGADPLAGRHAFTIGDSGVRVSPRLESIVPAKIRPQPGRITTGISGLDEMMHGGMHAGTATLVAGPSGAGKTVLGLQFALAGIERGEPAVFVTLQENEEQLLGKAAGFGWDARAAVANGSLHVVYLEPIEIGADAFAAEILALVNGIGAKRVVLDGLNELENSLHGDGRFPAYLWTLVSSLCASGATPIFTNETSAFFGPIFELLGGLSFVFDNVVLLRYAELESEIKRALAVVKMRYSDHAKSLVEFEIGDHGISVRGRFAGVRGVLSGTPVRAEERFGEFFGR